MKLQDYSKQNSIEGIQVLDLTHHYDCGGDFVEIARFIAGNYENYLGQNEETGISRLQINYSNMMPGAVKAWHLHKEQTDTKELACEMNLLDALEKASQNNWKGAFNP